MKKILYVIIVLGIFLTADSQQKPVTIIGTGIKEKVEQMEKFNNKWKNKDKSKLTIQERLERIEDYLGLE